MSFASYIPLAGCFCNFFFALFVFTRAPRATMNRVYLVSGLSIAVWNLGSYFLFALDPTQTVRALFWARFLQVGVLFEIAAFIHLSLFIAGFRLRRLMAVLYGFQTILALLNLTPWYIEGVRYLGKSGWYAVSGPAFHLINLPYCASFIAIFFLLRKRKTMPLQQSRRLTAIVYAQIFLALLGFNDLLPILGMDHYPFTKTQVYPYGSLAVVFYGAIVAYAVLQNQLLGARIALSGAFAHILRFAFLFTIAGGLLLAAAILTDVFKPEPASFWVSLGVVITSALIAAVLFPRLFGPAGVEKWERRMTGDRFESQDQVRNFMENMAWYTDIDALFNDLHDLLTRVFKLKSYQIILRDETTRLFTLFRAEPVQMQKQLPELKVESPVFRFFEWGKSAYLTLNAEYLRPAASSLEKQAIEQLSEFGGQFCFPLASQSEPFGLFLVGEKKDNEPYTATDITLLVALMKNLSLMVNQIRLKNHILQTQELDLLGRMSRGMAHDLNNLLTPVWTLFQLSSEVSESGKPPEFDDELLPSALRNIKIMRAYIREALFFSENLRPDIQLCRLDLIVKQAAELGRASRKKFVNIITEVPENVLVEFDEVLIQRLIANLISNAIDASPESSTIRVELVRLAKTEASRDWLRVRVSDQGEGIRKEDLNRIFTPYFTTKNHGDENRGFGLGLAICRKIVNLHGGNVSISSQLKKGTTVELDLPSRQQKLPPVPLPETA